ncbi:hypothetical protein COCVIDRAFT_93927 [Bipolaris victoriae FI3]|uniref:Uncharacterized protein n=1 Tax=Bipolaris victoriae (strain FI3) TaxID=930091 RepID=W7EYJ4_BIPV3|nr:hypothetical protein COCVIDRAFT_93927 [Bipolaris victoriae FI3]
MIPHNSIDGTGVSKYRLRHQIKQRIWPIQPIGIFGYISIDLHHFIGPVPQSSSSLEPLISGG